MTNIIVIMIKMTPKTPKTRHQKPINLHDCFNWSAKSVSKCNNGESTKLAYVCNSINDCKDGSDETNCGKKSLQLLFQYPRVQIILLQIITFVVALGICVKIT